MRQLFVFLIHSLMIVMFEVVDGSFANWMSVDAICVMASYTTCGWLVYNINSIIRDGYKAHLNYARLALVCCFVVSVILGVSIFALSDVIPLIFKLTSTQRDLLSGCLKVRALITVAEGVSEMLCSYMAYTNKNKQLLITSGVYYVSLVAFDVLVVFTTNNVVDLIWGTFASCAIYLILCIPLSGISKEPKVYSKTALVELIKSSLDLGLVRLLHQVGAVSTGVIVSWFDSTLYAIHGICYNILAGTENFTDVVSDLVIARVTDRDSISKVLDQAKQICRKSFGVIMIFCIVISTLLLFMSHGVIPLTDCAVPLLLYLSQLLLRPPFNALRSTFIVTDNTKCIRWLGLVSAVSKISWALLSYWFFGFYVFALCFAFDTLMRYTYLRYQYKRIVRQ